MENVQHLENIYIHTLYLYLSHATYRGISVFRQKKKSQKTMSHNNIRIKIGCTWPVTS